MVYYGIIALGVIALAAGAYLLKSATPASPHHISSYAALAAGVVLLIAGIVYCISEREWQLLRQVLLFAGAFVFCVALLSGTAWMTVRIITRRSRSDSRLNHNQDA